MKRISLISGVWILPALLFLLLFQCKTPERAARISISGFMIDAPRTAESLEYYFRVVDFCHDENLNTIFFRLTDDQGSALRFISHPELALSSGAFTAGELKQLVKYAEEKGIQIIPEVESFGHARYILQADRYKFLNDGPAGADFNAICPVSDSTLRLMKDLYAEVATIFPAPYFHIGCDEINWGESKLSRQALQLKSRNRIWSEYVNKLNGYVKALGKKTIIWGDVPIYQQNEVLDLLDKDLVIVDWNYWETNTEKVDSIERKLSGKGFEVIGCPAVSWCMWGPRVGDLQFRNINAYASVYGQHTDPKCLGILLSNWVPQRYLQNSVWDTYTCGAAIVKHGGNYNYLEALPEFVLKHFAVTYDSAWRRIYKTTYENSRQFSCAQSDSLKFIPWATAQQVADILSRNEIIANPFGEIRALLKSCREKVKKNIADFDDFALAVEFMDYNYNRQNELLAFARSGKTDKASMMDYIHGVANRDAAIGARIDSAWCRGRRGKALPYDKDNMWSFSLARQFSNQLSADPGQLQAILQKK